MGDAIFFLHNTVHSRDVFRALPEIPEKLQLGHTRALKQRNLVRVMS